VVIISDGFENDPPEGTAEVARVSRQKIDPHYSSPYKPMEVFK